MRELTTDVAINIYCVVLNLSENTIDKDNEHADRCDTNEINTEYNLHISSGEPLFTDKPLQQY